MLKFIISLFSGSLFLAWTALPMPAQPESSFDFSLRSLETRGANRLAQEPNGLLGRRLRTSLVQANQLPPSVVKRDLSLSPARDFWVPRDFLNSKSFLFPLKGGLHQISSSYGNRIHPIFGYRHFHKGWDIPGTRGTSVYPSRSGAIASAGWRKGYGLTVVVRHEDGVMTLYGHLSHIMVKRGELVSRGLTRIGRVGSTGLSTGPHLHFEVLDRHNNPLNPRSFLLTRGGATARKSVLSGR
ncbi:MAG: M23 family metallopeptidase [Elusimicrobia bacterium]|nr:M23 family metallopeptidase [Elusimicrobiota bacterium]